MITIIFPDGSKKEFEPGIDGLTIAKSISPKLAAEALAIEVNGEVWDLTRPIEHDAKIKIFTWNDEQGKRTFWHTSAHLMAAALEKLYPGIKFGIGPAIENGFYYDVQLPEGNTLSEKDFEQIEQLMLELARQKLPLIRKPVSKQQALEFFEKKGDPYKIELIQELPDGQITFYTLGDFVDLCRGPHLPHTGYIKAVKLLNIAAAYWRGDSSRQQLTRIYGISFPKKKLLDEYLHLLEEAKKRDHRRIGKEQELFMFSSNVGQGLPIWLPRGTILRKNLIAFLSKLQRKYGYQEVITPHIGNKQLYITSGHYQKYGQHSFHPFTTPEGDEEYMLKPMNCPHHVEIYKSKPRSYKDLPLRLAEFGTVYRYEQSGELHGLTRVRGFTQDDAHIFCTPEQLKDEFKKVIEIVLYVFSVFGFDDYTAQVSLRDPSDKQKYIGSEENWNKAERAIIEAAEEIGLKTTVELGEAAFYGPKLDFMIRDALGRKWQLGTIQVDYNLPERFNLEYIGPDDKPHRPVMIHRAPFGSLERFVAILIEHTAGKFPVWLAPEQVAVLPISDKFLDYARQIVNKLDSLDIRVILDDRNEKISRKIRDAEVMHIPYMLIIGQHEQEDNTVSVRRQGKGDLGIMSLNDFISTLNQEIQDEMKLDVLEKLRKKRLGI